jgi:cell division protein FtsN
MNKDYKDRVPSPRGQKIGIYSGLLSFLSGTALGGLLIGAGVLWLNLGPAPIVEAPHIPTAIPTPSPSLPATNSANTVVTTTPTPEAIESKPLPLATTQKLEFEYDQMLRDDKVTLPDPTQDTQIKIAQPPAHKEPSLPITAVTPPPVAEKPVESSVIVITPPEDTTSVASKIVTKKSNKTEKKTKTASTSTSKATSKKSTSKSNDKSYSKTKVVSKTESKRTSKTADSRAIEKSKTKTSIATTDDSKSKLKSKSKTVNTQVAKAATKKMSTDKVSSNKKKTVHLGAFQNEKSVNELRARMALMGIETTVEKVTTKDKKTLQKLRTAPYNNSRDLNEAKKLITKHNIKSFSVD